MWVSQGSELGALLFIIYGVRCVVNDWFMSYLKGGIKCFGIDNCYSSY